MPVGTVTHDSGTNSSQSGTPAWQGSIPGLSRPFRDGWQP